MEGGGPKRTKSTPGGELHANMEQFRVQEMRIALKNKKEEVAKLTSSLRQLQRQQQQQQQALDYADTLWTQLETHVLHVLSTVVDVGVGQSLPLFPAVNVPDASAVASSAAAVASSAAAAADGGSGSGGGGEGEAEKEGDRPVVAADAFVHNIVQCIVKPNTPLLEQLTTKAEGQDPSQGAKDLTEALAGAAFPAAIVEQSKHRLHFIQSALGRIASSWKAALTAKGGSGSSTDALLSKAQHIEEQCLSAVHFAKGAAAQLKTQQHQLRELEYDKEDLSMDVTRLKRQLQKARQELATAAAQAPAAAQVEAGSGDERTKIMLEETERMAEERAKELQQMGEFQGQLKSYIAQLKADLAAYEPFGGVQGMTALKAEHERLQVENTQLKSMIAQQAEDQLGHTHTQEEMAAMTTARNAAHAKLKQSEKTVLELESKVSRLRHERDGLRREYDKLMAKDGDGTRVEELQRLHEQQKSVFDGQLRAKDNALAAAKLSLGNRIAALERQLQRSPKDGADSSSDVPPGGEQGGAEQELRQELKKQKDRVEELMMMVELYKDSSKSSPEVAALQLSEKKLQKELEELQKELSQRPSGDASAWLVEREQLEAEVRSIRQELEEITDERDALKASVADLEEELTNTSNAFSEVSDQLEQLMAKQAEGDDARYQLMDERARAKQVEAQLHERMKLLEEFKAGAEEKMKQQSEVIREKEEAHAELKKLVEARDEEKELLGSLEAGLGQYTLLQTERAKLEAQLTSVLQVASKRGEELQEASKQIGRLESSVRTRQRELERERAVLDRVRQGLPISDSSQDVDALRSRLRCSVCNTREKDCMITKCCHTFCLACIEDNLSKRNRRCPTCKEHYTKENVSPMYL